MQKTSIIFLILAVSFFNALGQKQLFKKPKSKNQIKLTEQSQVPKGWKLIDLEKVSFLLPESMKDKKVRGTDSAVWRFESDEMIIHVESGIYTNDFQELKDSYRVKEEQVTIDGRNVKFFIWDANKDISNAYDLNKNGSIKPHEVFEKHFSIGVYFQEGKRRYSGTNFVIETKTLEEQETAKKILYSIKFKK